MEKWGFFDKKKKQQQLKGWWVAWELNMCGVEYYEKSKQFGSSNKRITKKPQMVSGICSLVL